MLTKTKNTYPLVSVIVPNYNHEKYLEKRLKSIFNQTYKNMEVILLDDCSTDNSKKIIQKHKSQCRIYYNKQNSGSPFKQWAKGISKAQGKWVWIAESDDFCESTFLETLINNLEKTNCVFGYTKSFIYYDKKKIIDTWQYDEKNKIFNSHKFLKKRILMLNEVYNISSVVFKKSIANKISREYIYYSGAGDKRFLVELTEYGPVLMIGNRLNYYRIHKNKLTNKTGYNGTNIQEDYKTYMYASYKYQKLYGLIGKLLVRSYYKKVISNISINKDKFIKLWNIKWYNSFLPDFIQYMYIYGIYVYINNCLKFNRFNKKNTKYFNDV